jgi:hypothetical protein
MGDCPTLPASPDSGQPVSPLVEGSEKESGIVRRNYEHLIEAILNETNYKIILIPHVTWAFNNVVLRIDRMENVKPDKPTKEAKIDPVITIVQALGTYLYTTGKYLSDSEIYSGQKAQK